MQQVLDALSKAFSSWEEAAAAALTLLAVWLAARNRIISWPIGNVSVVLYGWVFFQSKLYADMALQGFFLVTGFYGWWAWARGKAGAEMPVTTLTNEARAVYFGLWLVVSLAWGWVLRTYTDAASPYIDASLAGASVVAQILLTRRVIDNWPIWIAVDVVYAAYLYPSRGLHVTAVLYAILFILATLGLLEWIRLRRNETSRPADA